MEEDGAGCAEWDMFVGEGRNVGREVKGFGTELCRGA